MMMKRYFTEDEQRMLLAAPKSCSDVLARRDYAWMRLLKDTGFRITEFSLMTVLDALTALNTNYILIPKAHRKGKKRDHTKLVTQPVREALTDLLDIRREMGYLDELDAPLVMSRKHGRMSVRAYQERVKHWAAVAGISGNCSPHWFRHTRGMNIMRRTTSNDPRGIVQAELGHANIASTGIYTSVSREQLEAALEEVDGRKPIRKRDVRREYARRAAL
jgi:site-specific recombinase XerC